MGKFKDASIRYPATELIAPDDLKGWLKKSREMQWDYKHFAKRKEKLERLK